MHCLSEYKLVEPKAINSTQTIQIAQQFHFLGFTSRKNERCTQITRMFIMQNIGNDEIFINKLWFVYFIKWTMVQPLQTS